MTKTGTLFTIINVQGSNEESNGAVKMKIADLSATGRKENNTDGRD